MARQHELGSLGERFAQRHYHSLGFEVIAANFHSRYGEIDMIAENNEYIVFVEVKTRSPHNGTAPAEAVTVRKQRRIIQTAQQYLLDHPSEKQPRFDVVEILASKAGGGMRVYSFNLIENAFEVEGE